MEIIGCHVIDGTDAIAWTEVPAVFGLAIVEFFFVALKLDLAHQELINLMLRLILNNICHWKEDLKESRQCTGGKHSIHGLASAPQWLQAITPQLQHFGKMKVGEGIKQPQLTAHPYHTPSPPQKIRPPYLMCSTLRSTSFDWRFSTSIPSSTLVFRAWVGLKLSCEVFSASKEVTEQNRRTSVMVIGLHTLRLLECYDRFWWMRACS